ncbi:hypothetical protein CC2G_011641 [Coprinopsis cinerea AmutBmut pab1-1]|nr:hypothetical protein CC2G_011641 [Coprinopsis cinerea AmutBmut pab1-1]
MVNMRILQNELPSGDAIIEQIDANSDSPAPTASDDIPQPTPDLDTSEPPLCRICANRVTWQWVRKGLIEDTGDELWCTAGFTYSQQIVEKSQKAKPQKSFEEMVPPRYRHVSVFSESESHRLPEHKPWDHTINLIAGAPATMRTKVYPMSQNEQEGLVLWIPFVSTMIKLCLRLSRREHGHGFLPIMPKLDEWSSRQS